jgi:PKD repeat protein
MSNNQEFLMKQSKTIFGTVLVILCTLLSHISYGDEIRSIIVEYEYIEGSNVESYRLYENGALVCEDFTPQGSYIACEVLLTQAPMVFTLTAVDMDGVESPPSNEFAFSLPSQDEFGNYLPVINLQTDTASGTTPLVVAFDASLSTDFDGAIVSYQWDFADGTVGSGATISHVFETPGVFGVSLTIIDNDGAAVSSAAVITVEEDPNAVSNVLPTALINATPNDDGSITFDAYDSEDPDGTIQTYTWDFGDGSSGSGLSVVHDYAAAGNYTVTLSVVDDEGGISSDQLVVSIVDGNGSGMHRRNRY